MNTQIKSLRNMRDKVIAEQDKLFAALNDKQKTPEKTEELHWKLFDASKRYQQLCQAITIATIRQDIRFRQSSQK